MAGPASRVTGCAVQLEAARAHLRPEAMGDSLGDCVSRARQCVAPCCIPWLSGGAAAGGPARRGVRVWFQAAEQRRGCCKAGRLCVGAYVVVCGLCAGVAPLLGTGAVLCRDVGSAELAEGRVGVLGKACACSLGTRARAGTLFPPVLVHAGCEPGVWAAGSCLFIGSWSQMLRVCPFCVCFL